MHWSQAAVTPSGDYALVKFEYEYDFSYGNCSKPAGQREANKILNYVQNTTAPPRLAGQILLVHETVDQTAQPRSAWTYNPGQRRVRLAPNVAYDNPGTAADGLRTNDDFGMFNGATDRYNWKLVGKREMYVPYNSYKLSDPKLRYADILKPGHINQDLARYELHRVWVVEASLKPGTSHIYSKRVFYIDEDSSRPTSTTAAASCGVMRSSTTRTGTTSRCISARSRSTTTCSRAATSPWDCAAKRR
jgi:hypothetical protein